MVDVNDIEDVELSLEWSRKELKKAILELSYWKNQIKNLEEDIDYLEERFLQLERKQSFDLYSIESKMENGGR